MKRMWIGLAAVLILACQPGPTQKDEAAIIKAVQDELDGYIQRDHEKWASLWVHEPYASLVFVHSGGYGRIAGWDSLEIYFKPHFADTSLYRDKHEKIAKTVQNFGKTAIVNIEEITVFPGSFLLPDTADVIIFMEKREGRWLFVNQMVFFKTTFSSTDQGIENRINMIGYQLMWKNKISEAVSLFKLNAELFPGSTNVYDSLGEAYMKAGEKKLAVQSYEKSLKLNPENKNAADMLKKLKESK